MTSLQSCLSVFPLTCIHRFTSVYLLALVHLRRRTSDVAEHVGLNSFQRPSHVLPAYPSPSAAHPPSKVLPIANPLTASQSSQTGEDQIHRGSNRTIGQLVTCESTILWLDTISNNIKS
ncbi:hypothetical protein L596_001119 [Steinernema carpocapsae]|uniref:Uncharacterized protein n=1 Tax=Steinernema carpocapsae TaxID=34508 RepID=A0A4U8ULC8_STECR|nr:hypothetical protein L596_001119 [Steinernema carpocapsae]